MARIKSDRDRNACSKMTKKKQIKKIKRTINKQSSNLDVNLIRIFAFSIPQNVLKRYFATFSFRETLNVFFFFSKDRRVRKNLFINFRLNLFSYDMLVDSPLEILINQLKDNLSNSEKLR